MQSNKFIIDVSIALDILLDRLDVSPNIIDATKMNDKMNWQPAEAFETALRKTMEWYLK